MRYKSIYIVRHGETEQNRLSIVQGRGIDSVLNDTGHWQANAFYNHYNHIAFDRVYCSSQRRSFETIQKFVKHQIPLSKDPRIDEINWGEHEGKAGDEELMQKYNRIIQSWSEGDYTDCAGGGESAEELADRITAFLKDIENADFKTALICTHGRTLRAMICILKDIPLCNMESVKHNNTGLYRADYVHNNWEVILENDCSHLVQNPVY